MALSTGFSLQEPYDCGRLPTGEAHTIWYAQYGSPAGLPIVWLHGGPGSGSSARHQCFVDPSRYRLVMFDQRGCGRSTPAGETRWNDTGRLIDDIERLRLHLDIADMLLGGGSWGACLALAYANAHRRHLSGLILRAPFLPDREDVNRFFQPEPAFAGQAWESFASHAPERQRQNLLNYYATRILEDEGNQALALARAWARYQEQREQGHMPDAHVPAARYAPSIPSETSLAVADAPARLRARYRIQAHYLVNDCFLCRNNLLHAAEHLGDVPVAILHGADDRVCAPANSRLLHERIAGSRLAIVAGAGHDPYHPLMAEALLNALGCFAESRNFEGWGEAHARA